MRESVLYSRTLDLDTAWTVKGNPSLASGYPTTITQTGFEVGRKYLCLIMSAYDSGSFNGATWTGATQNWMTWVWSCSTSGYGYAVYNRLQLVSITATSTSITASIGTNRANWIVIASEDGPLNQ